MLAALINLPPPVLIMVAIAVVVLSVGLTILIIAILVSESAHRRFIDAVYAIKDAVYAIKNLKEADTKRAVKRRNPK